MLQLKVDTRFIDKKLILGIKQLLEEAYLFKFLTFLAPSEAPLCMQIIIFTYLWLFLEPDKWHCKDL